MYSAPGTRIGPEPTTLSQRAAAYLAAGPSDPVTLMREVCRVDRLQPDAAERMAVALLGSRDEFERLPTGFWRLRENNSAVCEVSAASAVPRLHDLSFAVVDVETTGTRAGRGDRVTEIAVVTVEAGQIGEVYEQLVNPDRPIPSHITALTHITWDMVRDKPRFDAIAPEVTRRLSGRVFTAHNATFDWRFVNEELSRARGDQLQGAKLCTVRLSRVLLPQLRRRSLDHVTRYFGVDIEARHRAAGDAVATARVLLRLLDVACDQGIGCWDSLQTLVSPPRSRAPRRARSRRRALPYSSDPGHIA